MESHRTAQRLSPQLKRAGIVALVILAMVGVTLLEFALCPMAVVLGIPCPGCGMTRATLAALYGNFTTSFQYHPLAMVMVPLVALYAAAHAVSYIRHGVSQVDKVIMGKWVDRVIILFIVAMLGVWIVRFFGAFGGPVPV